VLGIGLGIGFAASPAPNVYIYVTDALAFFISFATYFSLFVIAFQ